MSFWSDALGYLEDNWQDIGTLGLGLAAANQGSGQSGTVTTTNEAPAWLQPYLEQGAAATQNLAQQGGPQQYQGQTVVPFSDQTNQALNMTQNRALAGSPVTNAAQNLATRTLQGDFLQGNPYLDQTINRAVQLSRTNLDSQFGGYGRDLQAQMPARGEQVNNLVGDMMFRNYDAERQRQQGMVPMANSLANQDYFDINQLANVGGAVEGQAGALMQDQINRWNFEQNRPESALDAYLARLRGNPGSQFSQQTQPVFTNTFANTMGGLMAGNELGQGSEYQDLFRLLGAYGGYKG